MGDYEDYYSSDE